MSSAASLRVGVIGATGYTGRELLRLLLRHPNVSIALITSRQQVGVPVSEVHPILRGVLDVPLEAFSVAQTVERCDVVFSALPHAASMEVCGALVEEGVRVIDLSADYRLKDANLYAEWYGLSHADPEHLKQAVYGLPELFADAIAGARLVANPGCYPTAVILGLAPLVSGQMIDPESVIVDAKSGVSGAGRSPQLAYHFPECDENLWPYKPGTHRHTPEMEQVLAELAGTAVRVLFVPHVVPMERGICATIYARIRTPESTDDLRELFEAFYAEAPFVRVVADLPKVKDTAHTNYCDLAVRRCGDQVIVFAVLDNLLKGAAGTAVQNMNLLAGLDQTAGLRF